MENTAVDIDRIFEEDEQSTTENTRMRPYLDIWDVSTNLDNEICSWVNFSALFRLRKISKCEV